MLIRLRTYLTIVSALLLPVVATAWARSYFTADRAVRAGNGWLLVGGCMNGQVSLWTARCPPTTRFFDYRTRRALSGVIYPFTFHRMQARQRFWLLGFGAAEADRLPLRFVATTSPARGWVIPLWFPTLLCSILPFWLIARQAQPYVPPEKREDHLPEDNAPPAPALPAAGDLSLSSPLVPAGVRYAGRTERRGWQGRRHT